MEHFILEKAELELHRLCPPRMCLRTYVVRGSSECFMVIRKRLKCSAKCFVVHYARDVVIY